MLCSGISFNQYLTYLPVPTLASSQCNSSAQYNGHLTPDMICSMANGDSRVCHVSYLYLTIFSSDRSSRSHYVSRAFHSHSEH